MSSQIAVPLTEAAIWARLFQSEEAEVTRYLLSLKFPTADDHRVNELSAKARAGALTDGEAQELDNYLHIASLLAVMQSKARRILQQSLSSPARKWYDGFANEPESSVSIVSCLNLLSRSRLR